MKIYKKCLLFIAFIALLFSVDILEDTYAKYVTVSTLGTDITLARWNILVNDNDITQSSTFTNAITPTIIHNDNIKDNVVAPTSEGYFDIVIDASNTDVAFDYTITVTPDSTYKVDDIIITKVAKDGVDIENSAGQTVVTENIAANDANKTRTLTFYIKWNDDEDTQTLNNAADVTSIKKGTAKFNVNVNVIQSNS